MVFRAPQQNTVALTVEVLFIIKMQLFCSINISDKRPYKFQNLVRSLYLPLQILHVPAAVETIR